ncbi:hypothetical protein GGR51DRAFT_510619 [Nemania sp. FL0031]|nr:hypothetical protein GGR51DRAFT_510619 [Nemania sp. FL0031]
MLKHFKSLPPQKTPGYEPLIPKLTRDILISALGNVASYVKKKGGDITVVAVGGAVNTIHLRSRLATQDLDFFNNRLTPKDFELLVMGARESLKRDKTLEEDWFNNRTILFMPQEQRSTLTDEAFNQQEVIFHQPGLTILAAPWNYAFCCKVDRLAGGGIQSARIYDLDDAVQYLAQYLKLQRQTQIQRETIKAWFARFLLSWNDNVEEVIVKVNRAYQANGGTGQNVIV